MKKLRSLFTPVMALVVVVGVYAALQSHSNNSKIADAQRDTACAKEASEPAVHFKQNLACIVRQPPKTDSTTPFSS